MNEYQELCKQVYERLGWEYGGVIRDNPTESMYGAHNVLGYEYSADYLLGALPIMHKERDTHGLPIPLQLMGNSFIRDEKLCSAPAAWWAGYERKSGAYGDKPSIALLKLTLALCDAGVLKPTAGKEQPDV